MVKRKRFNPVDSVIRTVLRMVYFRLKEQQRQNPNIGLGDVYVVVMQVAKDTGATSAEHPLLPNEKL